MPFRIVIAGETQCEMYAHICLVADYLSHNLPNFCYERIEKTVIEWQSWLNKMNAKNKWHHLKSPLVWKELVVKGSKPHYIGGASEFLEYCHSYYNFDAYVNLQKLDDLNKNNVQLKNRLHPKKDTSKREEVRESGKKSNWEICISGASHLVTTNLLSGLLEITSSEKNITKIYLYDDPDNNTNMEKLESDCSYVSTKNPSKVVRRVGKLGMGLTLSDLLIVLDHVPYRYDYNIGDWLELNKNIMHSIADTINAAGPTYLRVLLPNLGPSCYNATIIKNLVKSINKNNIIVATSDLGLEVIRQISEIAKVPAKNIYCPPVWGFVGINHLVDVRTTIHRYDTFYPYERYKKVNKSTLKVGYLTPEMRMLEYLIHNDDTLWMKVTERKAKCEEEYFNVNKVKAVVNTVRMWLLEPKENDVTNLGLLCDGSFGLTFNGIFSQPARFVEGYWRPAHDYMLPKDPQMKLSYLEYIANYTLGLESTALPVITPHGPNYRRPSIVRRSFRKHDIRFEESLLLQ